VRQARQLVAEGMDVLGDFGVFEDEVLIAQAAHDHAADLVFIFERERRLRRAADVRQVLGLVGALRRRADDQRRAEKKRNE
jgi:hypothetical protein